MKRDVMLSITGLHSIGDSEDDRDNVATVVPGQYFQKNDKQYVLYEEKMDENEGTCTNRIKFTENKVELTKRGIVDTTMIFEENQTHTMMYKTPFGDLLFGVNTDKISVEEQEDNIVIHMDYALEMGEETLSQCHVKIEIRERP